MLQVEEKVLNAPNGLIVFIGDILFMIAAAVIFIMGMSSYVTGFTLAAIIIFLSIPFVLQSIPVWSKTWRSLRQNRREILILLKTSIPDRQVLGSPKKSP